jgi:hypothetical protein
MEASRITSLLFNAWTAIVQPSQVPAEDPPWLEPARELWSLIEPYKYFLIILIVFWFLARRTGGPKDDFTRQAQAVLEEKYKKGEISKKAYEKYRQDISIRPKG